MSENNAVAEWHGNLKAGSGNVGGGGGNFHAQLLPRAASPSSNNPDELLGAAHASCFTMALAGRLASDGRIPDLVRTVAHVSTGAPRDPFGVARIHLEAEARAAGLDHETLRRHAEDAAANCPMSRALKGNVEVTVEARLSGSGGEPR